MFFQYVRSLSCRGGTSVNPCSQADSRRDLVALKNRIGILTARNKGNEGTDWPEESRSVAGMLKKVRKKSGESNKIIIPYGF